mgnify:CR=1 FL=1
MTSNPALVKLFEDQFAPQLSHKVDTIKEQCDSGLYTLKRTHTYLKKVVLMIKTNGSCI